MMGMEALKKQYERVHGFDNHSSKLDVTVEVCDGRLGKSDMLPQPL